MKLSIIIPTHARGDKVLTAVKSVLESSSPDIEIIVVEDRTSDGISALTEYIETGRIRYVLNDAGPFGAAATRNLGVNEASANYVLFLDDDDQILPGYVDKLLVYLSKPGANWGFCDQKRTDYQKKPRADSSGTLNGVIFKKKIAATSAGFWINRNLFLELGGFDVEQTIDEDTDLCCRLLAQGEVPYYMKFLGIKLSRNDGIDRLTSFTKQKLAAECTIRTLKNNVNMLMHDKDAYAFLLDRAHRVICKSGHTELLRNLSEYKVGLRLRMVWFFREIKYRNRVAQ